MNKFINVFTLIEKLKIEVLDQFNSNYQGDLATKFDVIYNEVSKIKSLTKKWKEKALRYEIEIERLNNEIKDYEAALSEYEEIAK